MKTPLFTYSWLAALMIYGAAAELDQKSARYHDMLLKKPESTAVLSRFIDAWLEQSNQAELADILKEKAASGGAADWRVLAAFYEFSGNDSEAIIALDAAVKADRADRSTRLARAKLLGKLLLFDRALTDLTEAIKDPNLELEATTLTGRYLARAGQPEKAVEAWSKLIAAHPDDIGLQEDLLDLLIEENLMDQAIATSQKLTEGTKDPYQKAIRRLRTAQIYSLASKKVEAAQEYQAILAQSAQDSWLERETLALTNKLFIAQDDSEGWKKFLEEAIAAAPKRTALQENMAQHLMSTGNIDEAVTIYRNLIQTNPGLRPLRESLIALLEQAGRSKEASEELTSLIDQNPKDPLLWEKLATLHQKLGDHKAISTAVNKAAVLMPEDETGAIQRAQLYLRFQFKDACEIILRDAAKTHGPLSEAADNLAVFLATNNKADEAVKLWVDASKKADRESLLRISRSLSAHGKLAEAYQILADREKDFSDDALVLTALCQAAQLTDKAEQAIPAAITLVKLSIAATDIENSVKVASTLIIRAQKSDDVVQQLSKPGNDSLGELCLLAQLHENTGDTLSSEKALADAAAKDDTLAAAAMRISLLETRGDTASAIQAMRDLIAKPGGNKPHFLKRLVELLQSSGDIPAALVEVAKWKTIAPGDKAAWLKHAELFAESGEPENATAELRRACAKFGNDEEMRQKLVSSQMEAGAHTDALRILMQLHDEAESTATKIKYASQIAETSTIEGRAEEIEQLFRKRSRDNPTAVAPLLVLREMLLAWQRNEEAAELLQEASRRKPDDLDLQAQVAELWESQGDIQKAEALLVGLSAKHNSIDLKRRLTAFYTRNGYADKAEALIKEIAMHSSDARQIETIAVSMITTQQSAQALDMLRIASTKFPLDWRISYLYAYTLELNNKKEEAFQAFVALSKIEQEIPNFVAPLAPKNAYNPYYGYNYSYNSYLMMQQAGGDQSEQEFQQFANTPREAYLQQNQYNYGYGSAQPMQLQLPNDAKTLRRYALVHALTITKKDKEELAAERIKQLRHQEFPFWNAFVKIAMTNHTNEYPALLEETPVDPYLVKLLMRYSGSRYDRNGNLLNSDIKQETWQKVSAELAEKNPAIAYDALNMSYRGIGNDEHTSEEWQKLLDLLVRVPAKERISRIGLYQNITKAKENLKLTPEQWKQVDTLIEETMKANEANLTYKLSKLGESLQTAATAGEYVKAAELSNEFIKISEKLQLQNPYYIYQQQQFYQSGGSQSLDRIWATQPVPFTPQQLIEQFSYDDIVMQAMNNGVKFIGAYRPNAVQVQPKLSTERAELMKALKLEEKTEKAREGVAKLEIKDGKALLEGIMKLERPLDRVLALYAFQLPALLDPLLTQLTAEDANPDDKLLLWASAYQASDKKNLPLAYELAVRARGQAKRELQSIADQQVILLGALLLADKENKVDLAAAKSALLRVSKLIVDQNEKPAAAKKLKQFGLEMAAERVVRPSVMRNRNPRMASFSSGPSAKNTQDAATLARKGNRAGAATKLYQQARQILQQQQGNQSYYLRQLKEVVSVLKLEKDIAAQMKPALGATYRERLEYLRVICAIDQPKNYTAELKELYRENPKDPNILKLMSIVSEGEMRKELAQQFTKLAPKDMMLFGNGLVEEFNDDNGNMDEKSYASYLARFELVIDILEAQSATEKNPNTMSWVNSVASQLMQNHYVNGDNLRSFQTPPPAPPKVDNPLCVKRDEIIHRMALAMVKNKDTSNMGLSVLETGKNLWKLDEKSLQQIAMTSYKKMLANLSFATPKKMANATNFLLVNEDESNDPFSRNYYDEYGYAQGTDNKIFLTLAETIQQEPLKSEDLLPSIPEKERKLVEDWLQYFSKPNAEQTADRKKLMQENIQAFTISLQIAKLLNITVLPSMELLINYQDPKKAEQKGFTPPDATLIAQLIDHAANVQDIKETETILTSVTERYLGEKKLWPLYETPSNRGRQMTNEIDQRISYFMSAMNQQQQQRPNNVLIQRFMLANQLGQLMQLNNNQIRLDDNAKNNAQLILKSGLLRSGPGMFLVDGSFFPDKALYFSYTSGDNEEQKGIAKELGTVEGDNRFWSRIVAARYKQAKGAEILPEITREMNAIKSWPEIQKTYFANWLYQTWPDLANSSLRTWLKPNVNSNLEKHEKIIKDLPDQFANRDFDQEKTTSSLTILINDDPKKAAKLWKEMMEKSSQLNLSSNSSVNGVAMKPHEYLTWSIMQNFQYSSSSQKVDRLKTIQFIVAMSDCNIPTPSGYSFSAILSDCIRRISYDSSDMKVSPALASIKSKDIARIAELLRYTSELDAKNTQLILRGMAQMNDYINAPDNNTLSFLANWLEKAIAPKNPLVAKFGYVLFHTQHNALNNEATRKKCIAVHLELYKDKTLDDEIKLTLFSELSQNRSEVYKNKEVMDSIIETLVGCDLQNERNLAMIYNCIRNFSQQNMSKEVCARLCRDIYPKIQTAILNNPQFRQNYGTDITQQWLLASIKSEDKALFADYSKMNPDAARGNLECIIDLMKSSWTEEALALIPKPGIIYQIPEELLINNGNNSRHYFSAELEKQIAEFLPKIADPQQRFRFECIVSNLRDAANKEKPSKDRTARLIALANRFKAEAPPQRNIRMELLCFLDSGSNNVNMEEMLSFSNGLDLADVISSRFNSNSVIPAAERQMLAVQQAMIERTMSATLRAKKTDYFIRQMKSLSQLHSPNNYYSVAQVINRNLTYLSPYILNELVEKPQENAKLANEFIEICTNCMLMAGNNSSENVHSVATISAMAHSLSGQGKNYAAWQEQLSGNVKTRLKQNQEYYTEQTYRSFGKKFLVDANGKSNIPKMMTKLLSDDDMSRAIIPHATMLSTLMDQEFISMDELKQAIEAVPDTCLRKPEYLTERAGIIGWRKKDFPAAEKDYDRARELAKSLKQDSAFEAATAYQARMYGDNGKKAEAEKLAATVDVSKLSDKDKKFFGPLTKFAKPVVKEPAPEPATKETP